VNEIKEYSEKLGIDKQVHIFEDVPFQYIPAIYKKSDVLILPEMGKEVANAGFPGKTSEYLAAGKAIIATDFSNIKDVLKHEKNVMISPVGDVPLYSENFVRLITDSSLRDYLGRNAIQTAIEKFDYRKGVMPLVEELT
jgi:glycosyltransferase involved in cell wall biosynthesis